MIFSGKYGWKASILRPHLPLQKTQVQPQEKDYQNASQNGYTEEKILI